MRRPVVKMGEESERDVVNCDRNLREEGTEASREREKVKRERAKLKQKFVH